MIVEIKMIDSVKYRWGSGSVREFIYWEFDSGSVDW